MSARWVSFPRRVNEQPYLSRALSRTSDCYLWSGSLRVCYDAQVGKSGAPISPSGCSNEGLMDEAECTPKWCPPQLHNLDSLAIGLPYGLDCEEALRPTATFRTIAPLTPVRPACSEPIALIKIKTGLLWIVSAADTKCEVQIEHSDQKISDHLRHADVALARNGSNRIPRPPAVPTIRTT